MSFPSSMMAKLAWLTLMRLSEIRCLRREQVHLDQGVVRLPRAKGRRPRRHAERDGAEAAPVHPRTSRCASAPRSSVVGQLTPIGE
jgi:hypothetical protein